MDKVFTVELTGNGNCYATVDLPLTPYGMLDALDKLRMTPRDDPKWEICDFHQHHELYQRIGSGSIYQLNVLAAKLSEMDAWASTAFEGLVRAQELKDGRCIQMDKLIDFACGAHNCHIVDEAHTDEELGRFLVNGGFVPEADDVPDKALALLDYDKIGRNWRLSERGAFTKGGYVMPVVMEEIHKSMDYTPKKPDYTALLELGVMDAGVSTTLKLPTDSERLSVALQRLGVENGQNVSYRCADCRVPALCDAFSTTESIAHASATALELARIPEQELPKYKALIGTLEISNLNEALDLAQRLDEYTLSPELPDFEAIARDELNVILGEKELETLLPCVNLYQYGRALQEKYQLALTDYGSVERSDNQPLMTPQKQSQPSMGGMEMM